MNGEKHVTAILLIVVVIVALMSTYAWFSVSSAPRSYLQIASGAPVAFSISDGQGGQGSSAYNFGPYSGQRGYDANGVVLTGDDAPYSVYQNIAYTMSGSDDVTMTIELESVVVEVGLVYSYSFDQTLNKIFGLTNEAIGTLTDQTRLNYYVTSAAYSQDSNATPTGANPNAIYMVYNTSTNKVTHLIFTKSVVSQYMSFDYWASGETPVTPSDTHTSAKNTGILLEYGETVSEAGVINYVCVQALFYGNDGVKNTTCIFSDNKFQGSTFVIKFSAGGV